MAIKDFSSEYEYRKQLAEQKGISRSEEQELLARKRGSTVNLDKIRSARRYGHRTRNEHEEYLAIQEGYSCISEKKEYLARIRQRRPLNRRLSYLLNEQLEELGKTQRWLAEQIGVSEGVVSRYASGRIMPKQRSLQRKLFSILKLPYETLDALV